VKRGIQALLAAIWLAAISPSVAEQVGAASALRPQATQAAPAAQPKELALNAPVFRNAEVKTAAQGLLEITFLDQSKLSLGGDSEAVIDEFQYTGPGAPGDQVLKFSKGVFRFISGAVPKDKVKIETPTSLIGIRGTTLRTRVEADGTTTVGCDSGQVFITSRQTGQTITLNPGEKVTIKPGGEIGPIELGRVEGCPE
jgi:hypothetical protein